ncbi:MAG: restriction endonuclease subunit S [Acetobacteraceae bacterium]
MLDDLISDIEAGKNVAAIGRPPQDGETGIVKVSAVTWGEFDEDESKTLYPGTKINQSDLICAGDFLISRANTRELVGAPVIVKQFRRRLVLSDKVLRLCVVKGFDRWLELFLKSHFGRTQIEHSATGAQLSMRNISQSNLRLIYVPVAPPNEQARIVAAVSALFEEIEAGEAALARARENLTQFRASLLHAACTGSLTADWRAANPSNQTARELLLDIATWRTKRGLKPISTPITCNQAAPPRLPPGWTWASLPQLGEFGRGKSKHRPRDDARLYGEAVPFIQTGEVSRSRGLINSWTKMYSDFGISQSKIWPAGTVCITIAANIAASGILAFDACFPDSVVGLITPNPAVSRYVELFIQTARANLSAYAPATAQKNINLDILNSIAVPLPPLSEIQAIVETVEALEQEAFQPLSQVSDTVALRQSVLHAAFTGRLVPQDPADEPAETLLARLRVSPTPASARRRRGGATQPDLIETKA